MTVAAVAVGAVAVGAAAYSASAQSSAAGKAGAAQAAAAAQARKAITEGVGQARTDLQPYSEVGKSALKQLAWSMGLDQPADPGPSAPNTWQPGQTNDPVWEKLLADFNAQHTAWAGQPMNRPWDADADAQAAYNRLAQQYKAIKDAEPKTEYRGQGEQGALMQNYDLEAYKKDPAYTPFVNTLEDLQATPGYQFRLNQGLDSSNNSASAKGSLLSGGQLKALNNYASDFASTEYQNAWSRAQTAYQNAFNRDTTNKNNTFQRLQSMSNNGQAAAGQQGAWTMAGAGALAGIETKAGENQANLALAQGQINANLANGIAGGVTGAITGIDGKSGGGGLGSLFSTGGGYGGGGGQVNGLSNAQLSNAISPTFNSGWYG